jgi:transposase
VLAGKPTVGRLTGYRRIATRYEKLAVNYLAWIQLTATVLWLRPFADTP